MPTLLTYNLVIIFAALAGGLLPLVRSWSDRVLHLFVAGATGVFLGTTFVHLLPEFAHLEPDQTAWSLMAVSVVVLFAVERVGLRAVHIEGGHTILGYATFIGLSLHSVAAGYAMGVGPNLDVQRVMFLAICAHKSVAAFSLTTVLLLAHRSRNVVLVLIGLFSLMVPIGAVFGRLTTSGLAESALALPMAVGTGTFIYVSLCDLLPDVFHHRQDALAKLVVLVVGLATTFLVHTH
jgi:zinc transporter ZupT